MKKDIANRQDILLLVTRFYEKLLADPSISYLFTDVARIHLPHHFETLVDFWDHILFQNDVYRKNAMEPHLILHRKSPLNKQHFETWLKYFKETVDELFEGEKAFLQRKGHSALPPSCR
jgi:hemoglobin